MDGTSGLRRAATGGVLIGFGLGGFWDGILLHQILQWHHLISSALPPTTLEAMRTNVFWDGLFLSLAWVVTLTGIFLLWAGARRTSLPPAPWLLGLLLIGWGIFHLADAIINHHVLQIHHVHRSGPDLGWDLGFLVSGPVLAGLGWMLLRADAKRRERERTEPR